MPETAIWRRWRMGVGGALMGATIVGCFTGSQVAQWIGSLVGACFALGVFWDDAPKTI